MLRNNARAIDSTKIVPFSQESMSADSIAFEIEKNTSELFDFLEVSRVDN